MIRRRTYWIRRALLEIGLAALMLAGFIALA